MCVNCDEFDIELEIHGPVQLKRILSKLRAAIEDNKLIYNSFESDRGCIGQKPFTEIKIEGPLPDIMLYYFDCTSCGAVFGLEVETYHGQGGKWSRL